MSDSDINKYLELMSKIEYKDKDNDRLFSAVSKTLYDNSVNDSDRNVKIERTNTTFTEKNIDKSYKNYKTIQRFSAAVVVIVFILISFLLSNNRIYDIYNRLLGTLNTSTPYITPNNTSTPFVTITKSPKITPIPTPTSTTANNPVELQTENEREFTEEEEIINSIYHSIFPERNDYIAFWDNENMFWAPSHMDAQSPLNNHPLFITVKYKYEDVPGGNNKIVIFDEPGEFLHLREVYCVIISTETNEVISKRYNTFYSIDSLSYKLFNSKGKNYIAFARNTWDHGQCYSSEIVSVDTMDVVWSIKDLYPYYDTTECEDLTQLWSMYKEVLTDEGIEIYYGQRYNVSFSSFELVKFISYEELLQK